MNEQMNRRIQKLMKINLKMENPPEFIFKFTTESVNLDQKINGLSDKEVIDILISKDEREHTSIGVMYHLLTSYENQDNFHRMLKYIHGAGVDYWHIVLCNLNMILIEMWHFIHIGCKEQLIRLIREGVRQNVRQIENVLINVFRNINGTGDWMSKTKILNMLIVTIKEHETWFKSVKAGTGLTASIITTVSHVIVDTPQPITKEDTFKSQLINFLSWVIRTRKHDCLILGKDFIIILTRLGRIAQFEEIWKELHQNPILYGVTGIEEYMSRPNSFVLYRLSVELQKKIDYMVLYSGGKNLMLYYDWMYRKHLRQNDGSSLRGEIIRYLCAMNLDTTKHSPIVHDNRVQLIHLLISTTPVGPDQQWLKCCLFIEWLGCDERFVNISLSNVEIAMSLIRYCLTIQAPPPSANSIIQASSCSPLANSLLEYLCKSVDVFLPSSADQIRKNVNFAMKYCKERFQQVLPQILENFKIDRKVADLMRTVWPDFMRSAAPLPSKKKMIEKEKEMIFAEKKESSSNETSIVEKIKNLTPTLADKAKIQIEKCEKEEAELLSSIKLLKGEVKGKIEALKSQWKELNDDADKCEAVDGILTLLFKNEDKLDDAQQELAAQCLLGIIGSVLQEDKSLLPEIINGKELSDEFSHPIYSILRMLCFPPAGESASDVMTNLMAAMREKDVTITYVFLYFIKGTVGRPQECIECYKEVARVCDKDVHEMLVEDLERCAANDCRLFAYLVPFIFTEFQDIVLEKSELLEVLCSNIDATQLRSFISDIIREEIKIFRKDTFSNMVMASVEWSTTAQWIFWHLVHADGVPIEWFLTTLPKLNSIKHDEAITNLLLMLKHMDREPWPGLIRAIFSRSPSKEDNFTTDALKVLIDDSDQCQKVAELVGGLIKKLIGNNEIVGLNVKTAKNGKVIKVTLQQVLEHLSLFSEACIQKRQRSTELFLSKQYMQDAFATIKTNDKSSMLAKRYQNLFGIIDILSADLKEQSSRTLRGNRQGSSALSSTNSEKTSKRKAIENEDEQNNKKRKLQKDVIQLDDSDSD